MPRAQLTADELEAMRSRLSDAALRIYREEGLDAVSFRRIADALGISHTLPYRYFGNKEALLARVRTDAVNRLNAFVRDREPATQGSLAKVRTVIDAFIAFGRRHPADYLLIFATHQPPPTAYPELLAARRELFEHAVDTVQECIDAGEAQGKAREIAHGVWVSLNGLMTLHVANQLVHGYALDELIDPVMNRVLLSCAAHPVSARASAANRRRGTAATRRPRAIPAR